MNDKKYTNEQILEIIDSAAEKTMKEVHFEDMDHRHDSGMLMKEEHVSEIIDKATDEIMKKEQIELLNNEIKKRFFRIKSINKENFNMFEFAVQCHKLVKDYKQLAKLNKWTEIEALFKEDKL